MNNYALARQLADSGFPQGGKGNWLYDPSKLVASNVDRVYGPTLEELIEACGIKFHVLEHVRHKAFKLVAEGERP